MPERPLIVALIVGGFTVFAAGAILYVSVGPLDLATPEGREAYLAARTAKLWMDRLITVGVGVTAAGIAAFAGRVGNAAAHAGAALWIVAVALVAVTYLGSGEATRSALATWEQTGEMSRAYQIVEALDDGVYTGYVIFGFGGTALLGLGIAIARRGQAAGIAGWAAAAVGGCGALLALVGVDFIPGWVQLAALLLALAVWEPDVGTADAM